METVVIDEVLRKKQVTTFVILKRADSDWTLKGTERLQNPVHLNAPKFKGLFMKSKMCLGAGMGYVDTLYVEGAPTIFVEDLYEDNKGNYHSISEQHKAEKEGWKLKKGLRSLYSLDANGLKEKYRLAVQKNIGFEFGILSLDKYGDDPTLLEFVNCHEDNVDAPNAKHNKRGAITIWAFQSLQEEKRAEKKLDTLDAETEALVYVSSLRTKTKSGFEFTQANIDKINATLRILDMKNGLQEDDYNQKLLAIKGVSQGNPPAFMETINDEFNEKRSEIAMAIKLKVLEFPTKDKKEIKMTIGEKNGLPEKRTLITTVGATMENHIEELSIYFLTEQGTTDYRDLTLLCDAARAK